jgi:hypothetical protein
MGFFWGAAMSLLMGIGCILARIPDPQGQSVVFGVCLLIAGVPLMALIMAIVFGSVGLLLEAFTMTIMSYFKQVPNIESISKNSFFSPK